MRLITNNFRTHAAKQFIESWTEPQNTIYYVGAHRSLKFTNDAIPPEPGTDLESTYYDMYDELIFGKHVTSSDVVHMIRNISWVSGTVYDMYDSAMTTPELKNFYAVTNEAGTRHVFKCLNNNGGAPSTVQPLRGETNPEDDFYQTSDLYQWKYMYSITPSDYLKFATASYVPVFENADVKANAIPGSIDTLILENGGKFYYSYALGNIKEAEVGGDPLNYSIESSTSTPLSANNVYYENNSIYITSGPGKGEIRTITDYFTSGGERKILIDSPFATTPDRTSTFIIAPRVVISGDGSGAKARCEVVDGSISAVYIINRGKNYTNASIEIIGYNGTTTTNSTASVRPIVSPPGGHGSDVINELYANRVGIGVEFVASEGNTIPTTNDYRKVSLIKDPLFKELGVNLTSTSPFGINDIVTQASTNASARVVGVNANTVTLSDVSGFFETSISANSVYDYNTAIVCSATNTYAYIGGLDRTFETFDQRDWYETTIESNGIPPYTGFIQDEYVVQSGLVNIEMSDIIKLTLDTVDGAYLFTDGEQISQVQTSQTVTGTIIARGGNVLTIGNPSSYFLSNTAITGANSGATAIVTDYDNTFNMTASGVVHEVVQSGNTASIALTKVNGTFSLSDVNTNTINRFIGQTTQARAILNSHSTTRPKLVDGSGEIMYIENFVPIMRDPDQTERLKLVIEF